MIKEADGTFTTPLFPKYTQKDPLCASPEVRKLNLGAKEVTAVFVSLLVLSLVKAATFPKRGEPAFRYTFPFSSVFVYPCITDPNRSSYLVTGFSSPF